MSFSKDFIWGAASAAFQVEGAYNEDGKGLGIWDAMTDNLQIKHGETGNVAADHYHHYKEDVALMKKIGLKAYRFSVSWPRVMPERGVINEKGLAFYSDLVDELLNAGIKPMVTLFHWNLPNLPVARVMWKAMPNLTDGVECWITAGGAHHTVLSYDVTAEQMKDWARMMDIEFVHITKDTTVDALEKELFLNDLAWKLK